MNPLHKVILHPAVDACHFLKAPGTLYTVDIPVAERVGELRREPSADRRPGAERCKNDDRVLDVPEGISAAERYHLPASDKLPGALAIVQISLFDQPQKLLLHGPGAMGGDWLLLFLRGLTIHKMEAAGVQMLATEAVVEHEAVVHPTVDGKHGQRGELPDQLPLFAAGNSKLRNRGFQPIHGDILDKHRTDQMKREEFALLLFKIQDPQKLGAAGDYHGELFACQ